MQVQIVYRIYYMPYTFTKDKPIKRKYNGYKYELPNYKFKWTNDDWYETTATKDERAFVDKYVELLDRSLKYITDKDTRIRLTSKLVPTSEMPFLGCAQQIIHRYYEMIKMRNKSNH